MYKYIYIYIYIYIYYLCRITIVHERELNYYIHIGNSSGYMGETHSQFPKYLCMFDTEWNAHQINILDDLFD